MSHPSGSSMQSIPGPPYPPQIASLGGRPTVGLDVPITAVYMVLFIGAAVGHMTIFQLNRRAGHKFILSGMMFGFCMARITTCVMRIVWACYPTNVSVAIAAQIFVVACVVLLFVINLIFVQRLIRAKHPEVGWHPATSIAFKAIYILIVVLLVMLITVSIQSFFTLNPNTRRIDRDVQLAGSTWNMFVAFLPIPLALVTVAIPRKQSLDHFGSGRWRTKVRILLVGSVLLCLGAAFRAGTSFKDPRPIEDPAWYQSKACFYVFDMGVEILTIWLYLVARVDKRFHIPNKSKPLKSYEATKDAEDRAKNQAEDDEDMAEVVPPEPPKTATSEKDVDADDEKERPWTP